MSVPSVEAMAHGLECLYALGALDEHAELTALGSEMVYFPTEPQVSRMILASLDMEAQECLQGDLGEEPGSKSTLESHCLAVLTDCDASFLLAVRRDQNCFQLFLLLWVTGHLKSLIRHDFFCFFQYDPNA